MASLNCGRLMPSILALSFVLLLIVSAADARKSTRTRQGYGGSSRTRPSALHQPWMILLLAGGSVLVFVCCLLNGLRCVSNMITTRNEKKNARRRHTEYAMNGHQEVIIDQSELCQPPSYADIVNDVTSPPPPYSTLHVVCGNSCDYPPSVHFDDAELRDP